MNSNRGLLKFHDFLSRNGFYSDLDLDSFLQDLKEGLFLQSNVQRGYGLGSSGTVVAAVYDRYARKKMDDFLALKEFLGKMESCFHGSSSGIDPLQCLLSVPFTIDPKNGLKILTEDRSQKDIQLFLVDTGIRRQTRPLVTYFKEKRTDKIYLKLFQEDYVPVVAECIETYLAGSKIEFFDALKRLSKLQKQLLRPMVTDNLADLFGCDTDFGFGLKISGSGGGGYTIGFTDDKKKTTALLEGFDLVWL